MCYDISFSSSIELVTDYLPEIEVDPQIDINFSSDHVIAHAYKKYPVIIKDDGKFKLKLFEWGVIADYMNTPEKIKKSRSFMCNAQSEKILDDNRAYWKRIRKNRCLIPVTGIFEHREVPGFKNKIPYHVKMKERKMFCLPGLFNYSPIPDPETGEVIGTFTVVTRSANDLMKKIHNGGENKFRMPLFLTKELETKWLDPLTDDELKEILNFEMPSDELEPWPVFSIRTTRPRPDEKGKIDPYVWENLPSL